MLPVFHLESYPKCNSHGKKIATFTNSIVVVTTITAIWVS